MDLLLRLVVVLAGALVVVFVADRWQMRTRRNVLTGLPAGVAVVVTSTCRLCDALHRKLAERGVTYETVQADDARLGDLVVRAAPALIRVGNSGEVQSIRTGRAALDRFRDVIDYAVQQDEGAKP